MQHQQVLLSASQPPAHCLTCSRKAAKSVKNSLTQLPCTAQPAGGAGTGMGAQDEDSCAPPEPVSEACGGSAECISGSAWASALRATHSCLHKVRAVRYPVIVCAGAPPDVPQVAPGLRVVLNLEFSVLVRLLRQRSGDPIGDL